MYHYQIKNYRKQKKENKSMGYWKGLTAKNGNECNFYVEMENGVERYYNGKDKRHEYENCEPYRLIKDHTIKSGQASLQPAPQKKTVTLQEAIDAGDPTKANAIGRPNVSQEVKKANAERFIALNTPAGAKAKELLSKAELSHSSFTTALGMNGKNVTDKKNTKAQYDAILKELLDNDIAEKKGLKYAYK